MAFRPGKKQPQFADLLGILAQSKDTDSPTYQLIQILLERLTQLQLIINELLDGKMNETDAFKKFATKFATFHTKNDETPVLPNSVQLLAGSGILFDDSIANKRTISTTVDGGHYDCPLSDGDEIAAEIIFAAGECIIVQVPV